MMPTMTRPARSGQIPHGSDREGTAFWRWGRLVARRRRLVLAAAAVATAAAGIWGGGVFGTLSNGGFETPGSDSARIDQRVQQTVGRQGADVLVVYRSQDRTVEDPAFHNAVAAALDRLPAADVRSVATFWTTRSPALVSADRHATIAAIQLAGASPEDRMQTFRLVEPDLRRAGPGLDVSLGGPAAVNSQINQQVREDLGRAERWSMPILLVLLVLVFGSVVAAGLPLAVGALATLGAFAVLRTLTLVTDVSVFAINIVTLLGLGLAIDYALFVVSRFREEMHARRDSTGAPADEVAEALAATMATAGRTVAFSAVTVAASLAGLALFSQNFLRSMAFGGVAAVLVAMLAALSVLPAGLAVLGRRVDAGALAGLTRRLPRRSRPPRVAGGWDRFARTVMRRPVLYTVGVTALLLAAATPLLGVRFGGIDTRVLPAGAESRVVEDSLHTDFPGVRAFPIEVLVTGADRSAVAGYAQRLGRLDGVTEVREVAARDGASLLEVGYPGSPVDQQALHVVREVRATPAPAGAQVLVGGAGAEHLDLRSSLAERLPWMAGWVAATTAVLLFVAFGSVVLPLKAVVMNVLSVAASFGVVVWIFQEGHLSGLLGFTSTGAIEITQPILMLAILFGLSMDYEVFLLSRVREQWDRTGDVTEAVAGGLQRTGRIITSAALLLVVVIGAFSTSGITFIKMIGVGMAVAIVIDATVVRAVLVPPTLRLLGCSAWWAPGALRRWHERHGFAEAVRPAVAPGAPIGPGPGRITSTPGNLRFSATSPRSSPGGVYSS